MKPEKQSNQDMICQESYNEIHQNTQNISPHVRTHIQSCRRCRKEYESMTRIEDAVRSLPEKEIPFIVKQTIFKHLRNAQIRPIFRVWFYIAPIFFFLFTPLIISYLRQQGLVAMSANWFLFFSAFFTLWGVALIITLSAQILQQHKSLIEKLETNIGYRLTHFRK